MKLKYRLYCFFGFHDWCYAPDNLSRACRLCGYAQQKAFSADYTTYIWIRMKVRL